MNRYDVARSWRMGFKAKNSTESFWTDGKWLYSYNLIIGFREFGKTVVFDYTAKGKFVSITTSCHVGIAKRFAADIVVNPIIFHRIADHLDGDPVRLMIAFAILGLAGLDDITGSREVFEDIISRAYQEYYPEVQEVAEYIAAEFGQHVYGALERFPKLKRALLAAVI